MKKGNKSELSLKGGEWPLEDCEQLGLFFKLLPSLKSGERAREGQKWEQEAQMERDGGWVPDWVLV